MATILLRIMKLRKNQPDSIFAVKAAGAHGPDIRNTGIAPPDPHHHHRAPVPARQNRESL